ncbi:MAG: hypothetical protein QGG42_01795 [Phycisphaerae bacterium]|jgi:hypothetical protein|nr:hypothetical protein [Phycisphaerae bacterium]
MRYAIVLLLMLSAVGCGNSQLSPATPQPLENIHAEFRGEIEKTLPADYSSADINEKQREFMAIAKRVYGPHAAELRREAKRLLSELPRLDSNALDGLVERFPDGVKTSKPVWTDSMLYIARAWDPSAAALIMKRSALSRYLAPKEFGNRMLCQQFLPDRAYRSGGTASEPSVAIKSLQDIIIVKLRLQDTGCYEPQEVKWCARKK